MTPVSAYFVRATPKVLATFSPNVLMLKIIEKCQYSDRKKITSWHNIK